MSDTRELSREEFLGFLANDVDSYSHKATAAAHDLALREKVERLTRERDEATTEAAACVRFLEAELGWEDFRAEGFLGEETAAQSTKNCQKLREFLKTRGDRAVALLTEVQRLRDENERLSEDLGVAQKSQVSAINTCHDKWNERYLQPLRSEVQRLRDALTEAPHAFDCPFFNPRKSRFRRAIVVDKETGEPREAIGSDCNCFKRALSGSPEPAPKEVCICAAIRMPDGEVIRGHRHNNCYDVVRHRADAAAGLEDSEASREAVCCAEQGFVTSRNRFVNRKEAMVIQRASGLRSHYTVDGGYHGEELFSEDLYPNGSVEPAPCNTCNGKEVTPDGQTCPECLPYVAGPWTDAEERTENV